MFTFRDVRRRALAESCGKAEKILKRWKPNAFAAFGSVAEDGNVGDSRGNGKPLGDGAPYTFVIGLW